MKIKVTWSLPHPKKPSSVACPKAIFHLNAYEPKPRTRLLVADRRRKWAIIPVCSRRSRLCISAIALAANHEQVGWMTAQDVCHGRRHRVEGSSHPELGEQRSSKQAQGQQTLLPFSLYRRPSRRFLADTKGESGKQPPGPVHSTSSIIQAHFYFYLSFFVDVFVFKKLLVDMCVKL